MNKHFNRTNLLALTTSAIMIALASVLAAFPIFKMPQGGSLTLASMLPIMIVGVIFGLKWGLFSSVLFAGVQLIQAVIEGNVFVWCTTAFAVVICVIFDYVVPFGILGFSGIAKPKEGEKINLPKVLVTFGILMFLRFLCHFITGMTIWGQWDDGFWGAFIYSMTYNGGYMLPEAIFTLAITALLFSSSEIGKIIAKTNKK